MNDTNINNNSENPNNNTYHATTNLNTAIENPEINMGSITGVNIMDNNNTDNINTQDQINTNNQPININNNELKNNNTNQNGTPNFSDYSSEYETNFYNTEDNNQHYSYEPIIQEKKNQASSVSKVIRSKEAKLMVFILIILIIFLLIIPYIYDFFISI